MVREISYWGVLYSHRNVTEDSVLLGCQALSLGGQFSTVLRNVTFHLHAQYLSRFGLNDPEDERNTRITFEQ